MTSCATRLYNLPEERQPPVIRERIACPVNRSPQDLAGKVLLGSHISGYPKGGRPPLLLIDHGEHNASSPQARLHYSVGLLRSDVRASRTFEVVNRMPHSQRHTFYEVTYLKRTSVWQRFRPWHRDVPTLSRALAWSYTRSRHPTSALTSAASPIFQSPPS